MYIAGLQKLSLLDYPGKLACTVFTAGCNFRCPFCYNVSLVEVDSFPPVIDTEEVLDFLRTRIGVLEGVCITGGEPLLQKDLETFIRQVRDLGFLIKLDHNGSMPDLLEDLLKKELVDYVAVDIKNAPYAYGETIGRDDFDVKCIEKTLDVLRQSGVDFECRTTMMREFHNEERLLDIAHWIEPCDRYFLQSFSDEHEVLGGEELTAFSKEESQQLLEAVRLILPNAALRG